MLVPLVLPERLVIALVVLPVLVHVGEKLGAARVLDDGSDVGVLARVVAVCLVGAIAVVRPSRGLSVNNLSPTMCDEAYQRPWRVHESLGPVEGS